MGKAPIIIVGLGAVGLALAATATSAANSSAKKTAGAPPPPPPPKQDRVQNAADTTLDKLRALKAKADSGDKKARDAVNTLKDLYGRLKG
jgi:hypothetical protein